MILRNSLFFLMIRPPTRPSLFPYTTLFRSSRVCPLIERLAAEDRAEAHQKAGRLAILGIVVKVFVRDDHRDQIRIARSEEHTSELQSRENLVCRLLLEKKKAEAETEAHTTE